MWRLLFPIVIHNNFLHLFWNVFTILMIGFQIELNLKKRWHYLALLAVSGIGGNLLSAVMAPYTVGIGASGTIFGMLGVLSIWIWLNYKKLGPNGQLFVILFIVLMGLGIMNVFLSKTIDPWCHLGGLVTGVPFGILYLKTASFDDFGKLD